MDRVGVIGLGKMGLPIATNLMVRGFHVTGYRRSGSPELIKSGGTMVASAAEVAARSDVLLSIVPPPRTSRRSSAARKAPPASSEKAPSTSR